MKERKRDRIKKERKTLNQFIYDANVATTHVLFQFDFRF